MMIGVGSVTAAQLQAQTPGKQPAFITGSYPAATWTTYNDFNNGYGVYLPYSTQQIIANGPANQAYVNANQSVTNQFSALLIQAIPSFASGELGGNNYSVSDYCNANPIAQSCGARAAFSSTGVLLGYNTAIGWIPALPPSDPHYTATAPANAPPAAAPTISVNGTVPVVTAGGGGVISGGSIPAPGTTGAGGSVPDSGSSSLLWLGLAAAAALFIFGGAK